MSTKKKIKKLHLNINSYGTPLSTMTRFSNQMISVRYNSNNENRDFKVNGNQLLVAPLDLATDKSLETLLKIFDEKACALS